MFEEINFDKMKLKPRQSADVTTVSAEQKRDDLLSGQLQLSFARIHLLSSVHQVVVVMEVEATHQLLE